MGAALGTIALIAAAFAVLLIGLCFVPVDYTVSARTGVGVRFRARWLFGLVRFGRGGRRAATPGREARRKARRAGRRKRPLHAAWKARRVISIEGLGSRAARLALDLFRALGWRRGRVSVHAGTGDPAGTGELCGIVGPLLVWLPRGPALRVTFEPEFADAAFDAEAAAAGRLVPVRLLGALGRFALSRPGRRVIRVLLWNT